MDAPVFVMNGQCIRYMCIEEYRTLNINPQVLLDEIALTLKSRHRKISAAEHVVIDQSKSHDSCQLAKPSCIAETNIPFLAIGRTANR